MKTLRRIWTNMPFVNLELENEARYFETVGDLPLVRIRCLRCGGISFK